MSEQAKGYSWPPFEVGNRAAVTHGVWAADAADEARVVVAELLSAEDIERYPVVSLVLAETFVRWRRAMADIDKQYRDDLTLRIKQEQAKLDRAKILNAETLQAGGEVKRPAAHQDAVVNVR